MKKWFQAGDPWVWLIASAVSLCLIAVIGLVLFIASKGLVYFWPSDLYEFKVENNQSKIHTVIGEIYDKKMVPALQLREAGYEIPKNMEKVQQILVKTGNREFVDLDFRWLIETQIKSQKKVPELIVLTRVTNGNFYGYPLYFEINGKRTEFNSLDDLNVLIDRATTLNNKALSLQKSEISSINYQIESIRLKQRSLEIKQTLTTVKKVDFKNKTNALKEKIVSFEQQLFEFNHLADRDYFFVKDMRGEVVRLSVANILKAQQPNKMDVIQKSIGWFKGVYEFVSSDPREANTEGGVFPAIFGTVFMVLLMAVIVTPLGVVTAIYLHEYAPKNMVTKMIRISVINLSGVPSIVYGVFGLGFFVYILGGSIDSLFYPEVAPGSMFGSPGVLWSALTLAILTLPVVIVSTEEGLSRIPMSLRQSSLALGATKFETLWRIVIPMASPAIMTGLILAVARAAGEVAPLMLVGVVKLAPSLPLDMNFPYIHLERKFMHLGFHIFDVGFQSPNVEAARPLVYATSFLLITVIIGLNLAAIHVRNKLRRKFKDLEI
ncbi:phosphate ABC transporter permease PstA [Psychromonas sp. CD1]|uniref:phosphate ABC transporter permease PstA n=1 Tax=Psychromonas sp. CD1 TaxID=1979839 RepID=UPI000B9C1AA9|nr:phosphate ABC transporter permease PstA [Psychromonas sp. CD1]